MTMVVLLLGLVVTNITGWQPSKAAAGWVSGPLTSLAIAQLLLAVDLRRVWPDARRLLTPFAASVLLTLVAVLLGGLVFGPWLGAERSVLAGVFTATFTGGSLNFVSVARTLQPPESLLLVATAADHVVFAIWFALSLWLGQRGARPQPETPAPTAVAVTHQGAAAYGLALLWGLGVLLASQLVGLVLPAIPSILVLTTVALIAAQLPWGPSRRGCYDEGLLLIQPFFTVIGLSSPVGGLLGEGLPVLVYAAWIVALQAAALLLLRRWRRWPLGETLVASQAAIGGPSTALALATSLKRGELALPAVAIGLLGYLVGTYLGLIASAVLFTPAAL
jgi:uncharacterized membrane protein